MSLGQLPARPPADRIVDALQVVLGAAMIGSLLLVAWLIAGALGATGFGRLFATIGLLLIFDGLEVLEA